MRVLRRMGRALGAFAALCTGLALATLAPGDPELYPAPAGPRVGVVVLDHGYHTGLVLPAAALAAAAELGAAEPGLGRRLEGLVALFPKAEWIEVGWGDRDFYRTTPRPGDMQVGMALRALFLATPSAVHAVPGVGPPEAAFPTSDRLALVLGEAGFARLARALAATLAPGPDGPPEPLGPSLYGSGVFLPATPSYHALRTCNQWTASLLRAAGVPSSWFISMTSPGLMAELRLRAL